MAAEDRRRQLIEVAVDLFSKKGFAGTTTKEIAASAGVTEAIIFRHFASKQGFYTAILDHITSSQSVEELLTGAQRLMDAKDDAGLFRLLIEKIIASIRHEPRFERLMILAAMEGHELAELHMKTFAIPIGARLTKYFQQRQSDGALVGGSPEAMLIYIAGAAQFYALHRYIYSFEKTHKADEETVVNDITRFVTQGLLVPPQKKKGRKK